MNCHSSRSEPDSYSFNPAVRERILARTGKDIYRESVPLQMLLDERRDGLSEYIEEYKKTIGDRPLYLEGWGPGYGKGGMYQRENFGSIYPDYERLIRHDAIDGVVMWHDFSAFFEPKVLGGKKIVLGYYIGLVEVKSLVDKVQFLLGNPHLAMVDFYESLLFTQHPRWLQELQSIHR